MFSEIQVSRADYDTGAGASCVLSDSGMTGLLRNKCVLSYMDWMARLWNICVFTKYFVGWTEA